MRSQVWVAGISAAVVVLAACSSQQPQPSAPQTRTEPAAQAPKREDLRERDAASLTRQQAAPEAKIAAGAAMMAMPSIAPPPPLVDRENYAHVESNPMQVAAENPVSTFSVDVDTGSYSNVRRFLREGRLPPSDAVRVEEMINYFDYAYAAPRDTRVPFAIDTEMAPTPWNPKTHLLRVGLQGWKPSGPRVPSNLVFLVDVSGSMSSADKLPLVKSSLKMLARELTSKDRISLVVYAGASGVVLEPTPGDQVGEIEAALDRLNAGGSTNGASGIQLAYAMARKCFSPGANNRVLLATDGDFNVGIVDFESLLDLVKRERKSGIALTTLGFGTGNYNDHLMEQLADAGQGNYGYIDSLDEARKVLVEQRDATLRTIASDVKIQVEFNPAVVAEYRLIGYENRMLRREDFSNDQIDAGEIGAGHRVTALYEIALAGSGGARVEPLRYGVSRRDRGDGSEVALLRLRYKQPGDGPDAKSHLLEQVLRRADIKRELSAASDSFRLAASVAAFGQILRGGAYTGTFGYAQARQLAAAARMDDGFGRVAEFRRLLADAERLGHAQARAMD